MSLRPLNRPRPNSNLKKDNQNQAVQPEKQNDLVQQMFKLREFLQESEIKSSSFQEKMLKNQQQQTHILKDIALLMMKNNKRNLLNPKVDKESYKEKFDQEQQVIQNPIVLTFGSQNTHKKKEAPIKKDLIRNSKETQKISKVPKIETPVLKNIENTKKQQIQFSQFQNSVVKYETKEKDDHKDYKEMLLQASFGSLANMKLMQNTSQMWSNFEQSIEQYIKNLTQSLSQSAFYGYFSVLDIQKMNQYQTKGFFSKNLIYNYFQMISFLRQKYKPFWSSYSNKIISQFNKQFKRGLSFFKLKFPQQKKVYVDRQEAKKQVQALDYSEKYLTYIFEGFKKILKQKSDKSKLQKKQIKNQKNNQKEKKDASQLNHATIKRFINYLIDQTKNKFHKFQKAMTKIFSKDYDSKKDNNGQVKSEDKKEISNQKKKYVIGTKLPRTIQKYSQKQIELPGITIKSPEIMRVMIKWIQGLESTIKNCDARSLDFYISSKQKNQDITVQLEKARFIKGLVVKQFQEFRKQLENKSDMSQQFHLNHIQSLLPETLNKYKSSLSFVPNSDLKVGLFTSFISKLLTNITQKYLLKLINTFQSFYKQTGRVPFDVFDLFRCRYSGTLTQIIQVYKRLKQSQYFKIIKVKDRLQTQNRDLLVNFTIQESNLVCEIQLNISDGKSSQKQDCYDHFNHFLYQLQRSKYGPICQAVNILSNVQDHISYFSIERINELANNKNKLLTKSELSFQVNIEISNNEQSVNKYDLVVTGYAVEFPSYDYICSNCYQYKEIYKTWLPAATAKKGDKVEATICGRCLIQKLSPQDRTKYIMNIDANEAFRNISFEQLVKEKPQYILIVNDDSKKTGYGYKKHHSMVKTQVEVKRKVYRRVARSYSDRQDDSDLEQQIQTNYVQQWKQDENTQGVQYFKCMFGLDKQVNNAPEDYISLVNSKQIKSFFNKSFIFVLKDQKSKLLHTTKQFQSSQVNEKQCEYYATIVDNNKKFNFAFEFLKTDCTYTLIKTQKSIFVLEVRSDKYDDFVKQFRILQQPKRLAKQLEITGRNNWNLIGDFGDQLLKQLKPIMGNCEILTCSMQKLTNFQKFEMPNLLQCRISMNKTIQVNFNDLKTDKLKKIEFELTEANLSLKSNFPSLTTLWISAKTSQKLDFTQVNWPSILNIDIRINEIHCLTGFEETVQNPCNLPTVQSFRIETMNCPMIDFSKFKFPKTLFQFQITNTKGKTKCNIPFVQLDNNQMSSVILDFIFISEQQKRKSIAELSPQNEFGKRLSFIYIRGSKATKATLKMPLPSLDALSIKNSYIEELNINCEYNKFKSLFIFGTKLKSLDVSKLPNLQQLYVPCNQLSNIKFKDDNQMQNLQSINIDYNNYSQNFFNNQPIENLSGLITHNTKNSWQQFMITKLSKQDFQKFKSKPQLQNEQNQLFTQQQIELGKNKQQLIFSQFETTAKILQIQIQYQKIVQEKGLQMQILNQTSISSDSNVTCLQE